MGSLLVRRANDHGGMMRRLQVRIDGTRVAALKPNEQSIVELDAGPHVVIAKMDWFSSKDLTVQVLTEGQLTVEVSLPFSSAAKQGPGKVVFQHVSRSVTGRWGLRA